MAKTRSQRWSIVGGAALSLHLAVLGLALVAPQEAIKLPPERTLMVSLEVADNTLPSEAALVEVPEQALQPVAPSHPRMNGQASTRRARTALPSASGLPNERASELNSARGSNTDPAAPNAEETGRVVAANASAPSGQARVAPSGDPHSNGTLARKPRLLSAGATCQGVFAPRVFGADKVTIVLAVDAKGNAMPTKIRAASSTPHDALQSAAWQCARRLRFDPARSVDGSAVAATSIVSLTVSQRPAPGGRAHREGTI